MSQHYRDRKEKIQLLTDIMRGKKQASDIKRGGCISVVVWSQDEAGNRHNDTDTRTQTNEEAQASISHAKPVGTVDELHVYIIAPIADVEE